MRISLLTFPYIDRPLGGAMVFYEYANRLVQRGHTVHLVHGGLPESVGQRFGLSITGSAMPPAQYWFAHDSRVVLRHVPVLSPEEIPPGDILIKGALLPSFPRDRGTPVGLIQGFGLFSSEVDRVELSAPISKIGVSKWLCELARRAGTRERDIAYVPNGVDHSTFRVVHPIESRSPCIAMFWHPMAIKGSDVGLAALGLIRTRFPSLRAILFGVNARPKTLPDWVEYVENPSRERLAVDVYNWASLFLSPSRQEGFSLCGLEAMASGCALVCTDVPGMRDYVEHEITALASRVGDAAALAQNACRLLADDAARCAIAEAGRTRSLQFHWDRTVDLLEGYLIRFRETDLAG